MLNIPIIYEDTDLLVIEKPSGIVVNKSSTVRQDTVQDWAEKEFRVPQRIRELADFRGKQSSEFRLNDENRDFYNRSGIVHRLDKETSGLLLIAKNNQSFINLQSQFKDRAIIKKYITLVHGAVKPDRGEINVSVGRLPWNRARFGVLPGGRDALTYYEVMKRYRSGKNIYSLLEVTPHTGRTHQIRIHLKYLGFSVVGDNFYAGRKLYRSDLLFCKRLFLHAYYLNLIKPQDSQRLTVTSELPPDLRRSLEKLLRS